MSVEKLRKYIIRQLAGDFRFNEDQRAIRMEFRTLTPTLRNNIISEGRKWGVSDDEIEYTIQRVTGSIAECHTPRTRALNHIDPIKDVGCGLELTLVGTHVELGIAELKLLSMGNRRFFVLKSDRNGLIPGDIVKIADDRKWGVDHCVFFRLDTDGADASNLAKIYRTFALSEIRLKEPSEVIEIADSNQDFTFQGSKIEDLGDNDKFPISKNPMSLLLDNNAEMGVLDLHFNNGFFAYDSLDGVSYPPSPQRNAMFEFNSAATRERIVKLSTRNPGRLQLDAKGNLIIEHKAEVEVKED